MSDSAINAEFERVSLSIDAILARLADIEHVLNMRAKDDGDIRRVNSDVILRIEKRISEIERCIKEAGN